MSLLSPSEKIARRWSGALESRLREQPLELFLRSRGLEYVSVGALRITANVVTAGGYLLQGALPSARDLPPSSFATAGLLACAVGEAFGILAGKADVWPQAGQILTERLLRPAIGPGAAAAIASVGVAQYECRRGSMGHVFAAVNLAARDHRQVNDRLAQATLRRFIRGRDTETVVLNSAGQLIELTLI